jgi:hypothetical protein
MRELYHPIHAIVLQKITPVHERNIKGHRLEKPLQTLLGLRWLQLPPQHPLFVLFHMLLYPFQIYSLVKNKRTDKLGWYTKFYLGCLKMNPEKWYASLFEPTGQQICGEVTPAYSLLPDRSIEYMMSFNKHMRIIYLIRNPIERYWSHVSMYTMNPGGSLPVSVLQKYTDDFQRYNNYLSNLKRYLKYIPPENLFLGFYEDILFHFAHTENKNFKERSFPAVLPQSVRSYLN